MDHASYRTRRDQIETYFDRTALDAWKRLTSDEKVSGIRATVRAGREAMRSILLSRFGGDLRGMRILDAGCGSGQLGLELARRGADVLGIDLSAGMVRHARNALPPIEGPGNLDLMCGDMLSPTLGRFDAVVAMDSLIHYNAADVARALGGLADRVSQKIVFTLAPRTLPLTVMHAAGKLFPRSDRSPAIEPVATQKLYATLKQRPEFEGWLGVEPVRVSRGFYISEACEVYRA